MKALQSGLFVSQLIEPIWGRLITLEVLTGRLDAPDFEANVEDYLGVGVMWPAWASLDPHEGHQRRSSRRCRPIFAAASKLFPRAAANPQEVDAEIEADTMRPPAPTTVTETIKNDD